MLRDADPEITDLGLLGKDDVPMAATETAAYCDHRQRIDRMDVGIGHAAAVEDDRLIQQ